MIKVILAVLFLFCCGSIGYTVDFDQGDTWVSNRYEKLGTKHLYGNRVKEMNIGGKIYEFKKSGRNLYKAYDDETGNFLEMTTKGTRGYGEWEIYDPETDEYLLIKEPAKRE